MISQSDLIMVVIAFLIGYIDDVTGPQAYHYGEHIVIVDKKYQCPKYCQINHFHYVYFDSLMDSKHNMCIDKEKLGERYKDNKQIEDV